MVSCGRHGPFDLERDGAFIGQYTSRQLCATRAVELFRDAVERGREWYGVPTVETIRAELAGKDLVCWCPLTDEHGNRVPCHADVLLELANPGVSP